MTEQDTIINGSVLNDRIRELRPIVWLRIRQAVSIYFSPIVEAVAISNRNTAQFRSYVAINASRPSGRYLAVAVIFRRSCISFTIQLQMYQRAITNWNKH